MTSHADLHHHLQEQVRTQWAQRSSATVLLEQLEEACAAHPQAGLATATVEVLGGDGSSALPILQALFLQDLHTPSPSRSLYSQQTWERVQALDPEAFQRLTPQGTWWVWDFLDEWDTQDCFHTPISANDFIAQEWWVARIQEAPVSHFSDPRVADCWHKLLREGFEALPQAIAARHPDLWTARRPDGRLMLTDGGPWVWHQCRDHGQDPFAPTATGKPWWQEVLDEDPLGRCASGSLQEEAEGWLHQEARRGRATPAMEAYRARLAREAMLDMIRGQESAKDITVALRDHSLDWLDQSIVWDGVDTPLWALPFFKKRDISTPRAARQWLEKIQERPAWQARLGPLGKAVCWLVEHAARDPNLGRGEWESCEEVPSLDLQEGLADPRAGALIEAMEDVWRSHAPQVVAWATAWGSRHRLEQTVDDPTEPRPRRRF